MRAVKLVGYLILIIMVAVTIIVASSSAPASDVEEQTGTGTVPATTPNELEPINPGRDEKITVGVFLSGPETDAYARGIETFQRAYPDCTVVRTISTEQEGQLEAIRKFAEQYGSAGVFIVEPVDGSAVSRIADAAEEYGVYWSAIGETGDNIYPMDYHYYTMYQGVSESAAGYESASAMMKALDSSGTNELYILDSGEGVPYADRQSGLYDALTERLDVVSVKRATAKTRNEARQIVSGWLAEGGAVKAVWADDDELALGAADAAADADRDDIVISGTKLTMNSKAAVAAGTVWSSVYYMDAERMLYGLVLPYRAAMGAVNIDNLDMDERFFYVTPSAVTKKEIKAVLGADLDDVLRNGYQEKTVGITIRM